MPQSAAEVLSVDPMPSVHPVKMQKAQIYFVFFYGVKFVHFRCFFPSRPT
jgi:hypothetical protein